MVSLCLASICLLLCPALRVFVHLTWLVAWLSCLPCRIWCKIIIIIWATIPGISFPVTSKFSACLHRQHNDMWSAFLNRSMSSKVMYVQTGCSGAVYRFQAVYIQAVCRLPSDLQPLRVQLEKRSRDLCSLWLCYS
jgi:hypothetical protein